MTTRVLWAVLPLAMVFAGCESLPWEREESSGPRADFLPQEEGEVERPPSGLAVSPRSRFEDVPLPVDANEDADRTYVYESDLLQIGRMVYSVRASVNELSQFYLENAPEAGWELVNVLQAEGATLVFTKPGHRLQVDIERKGVGRGTSLILNYTPDDEGSFTS